MALLVKSFEQILFRFGLAFLLLGGAGILSNGQAAPAGHAELGITIEKIDCEGNRNANCDFIVSQTELQEGQPLNEDKVKEAKLRLMLLGYFDDVTIRLEKGSEFGKARMIIEVKERNGYSFYGNLGVISPIDSPYLTTDYIGAHRSLTGHGDPLSLRLRTNYGTIYYDTSPTQSNLLRSSSNASKAHELMARLEYTRPNFLHRRLSLTGGFGVGTLSNRHYLNTVGDTDYTFFWADIAMGIRATNYTFLTAGFRYSNQKWEQVSVNPANVTTLREFPKAVFVQYIYDTQDDPIFPTTGNRVQIGAEYELTAKLFHFSKFNFLHHWHFGKSVITARLGELIPNDLNFLDENMVARGNAVFSFRYTNIFRRHVSNAFISDGAYYFEPGLYISPRTMGGGVRVGTTLQTSMGTLNLFLLFAGLGMQE